MLIRELQLLQLHISIIIKMNLEGKYFMKNSELEQRLKECNYRLSKMDERIKRLEEENEQLRQNKEEEAVKPEAVKPEVKNHTILSDEVDRLNDRIKALSDELYEYIDNQIRQQVSYTDENKEYLEKRIKGQSDELYEYIGQQIERQKEFIMNR